MTIKQQGGIFGRNPTFNDADVDNNLSVGNSLNVDNGTFYVDPVNNRIGLGTTSPASDLTLSDGKVLRLYRSGNAIYTDISYAAGTGLSINDANGDGIRFQFGGNDRAYVNTNGLAFPSGKGIDFSATSGTGTSELFNDYEEGTWGSVTSGFSSATITANKYTKIGRMVYCTISLTSIVYSGTGAFCAVVLPFNENVADYFSVLSTTNNTTWNTVKVLDNLAFINDGSTGYLQGSTVGGPTDITLSFAYEAT